MYTNFLEAIKGETWALKMFNLIDVITLLIVILAMLLGKILGQ